jgi:hypothetical protein
MVICQIREVGYCWLGRFGWWCVLEWTFVVAFSSEGVFEEFVFGLELFVLFAEVFDFVAVVCEYLVEY